MNGQKECGIYIYNDIQYSIIQPEKKEETLPFETKWMDLEGIMLTEINQTEKDLTYMWNLKLTNNPSPKKSMKQTYLYRELEKEMATHSSILAWRIPGPEESVGCRLWGRTVGHDWSDSAEQHTENRLVAANGWVQISVIK